MAPSKDRTFAITAVAIMMSTASAVAAFSLFSPDSAAHVSFISPASADCPAESVIEVLDSNPVSIKQCGLVEKTR